ncbi:MAG TPA: hypothetical protein VNQ33_00545 [Acidimicrobiales bacterium]|nr:hypothetical protein [Acidimicrobiales bacterium]
MTDRPTTQPHSPRRAARWPGAARWLTAVGTVALTLGVGPATVASAAPAGPALPAGADGGAAVACLDQRLRPAETCPSVDIEVHVEADGDDLVVQISNAAGRTWRGGPLAVELPVPDAKVEEPEGRVDRTGRPGTPEWTTRVGTVVSRCVFEPVTELRSGADLSCRLRRLGLADGQHQIWFTGFIGGLPRVHGSVGNDAPAPGVVAAAATRSVRIQIEGDRASVAASTPTAEAGETEGSRGGRSDGIGPWPPLIGAVALAVAVGVLARKRRRST